MGDLRGVEPPKHDEKTPPHSTKPTPPTKPVGLLAIGAAGLAAFAALAKRELGRPVASTGTRSPTVIAARALGLGTMLCLSTASTVAGGVGCAMGVGTLREFADACKAWAPARRRAFEAWLGLVPDAPRGPVAPEEERAWAEIDRVFRAAYGAASSTTTTTTTTGVSSTSSSSVGGGGDADTGSSSSAWPSNNHDREPPRRAADS